MRIAASYSSQWKVCVEREFVFISGFPSVRGSIFVILNEEVSSCVSGNVPDRF